MGSNKRPGTAKPTQKTRKTKSARPVKRAVKRSAPDRQPARPAPLIVGIGASAGGLEAFTLLLQHLPTDTAMAFVLVQHLDPTRESALTQLISRATSPSRCGIYERPAGRA